MSTIDREPNGRYVRGRDRRRRRLAMLAISAVLVAEVVQGASARALTPGPAYRIGHWEAPFDEGGSNACQPGTSDGSACPPTATATAAMPDGRTLYFNGIEPDYNGIEPAQDHRSGAGGSRLLDLRQGAPRWATPDASAPEGRTLAAGGLYCTDMAQLPDGRLLLAGGGGAGGPTTHVLDADGRSFRAAGPPKSQRWHAGLVTLADGTVLMAGGARLSAPTETYDPVSDTWTENLTGPASETSLPPSPRLFVTPDGKVFYPGAGESQAPGESAERALWGLQQSFNPETGKWELAGPVPWGFRDGATSVMLPLNPPYSRATILTFGGAVGPTEAGVSLPLSTLTTVDRSGKVTNEVTGNTNFARRFSSAVPLPDGTVLALAGAGAASPKAAALPTQEVELFVPNYPTETDAQAHGRWFRMASPVRERAYHNSAVLLPDGRVFLGGGDGETSFEIFNPPYLYRGRRPTIRRAPDAIAWGDTFSVQTRQALNIESMVLMRLGSPQHGTDNDTRTLRLAFRRSNGAELQVTAPPDGAVAPPGLYYLFVNQQTPRGPVPSAAKVVRIGPAA